MSTTKGQVAIGGRFRALDGLRGVAALIVVFHHIILTSPLFDRATSMATGPVDPVVPWLFKFTPLHFFFAGTEAVYLFFILSGFVLALPYLSGSAPKWRVYYPKRLIRLYLPVFGGVLFALLMAAVVPRQALPDFTGWTNYHVGPYNALNDAYLLNGGIDLLNSPLWSLTWEVMFSLLLPVYVLVVAHFRKSWVFGIVGSFAIIAHGFTNGNQYQQFLPMFAIGVCLAAGKDDIRVWTTKIPTWAWSLITAAALVLFSANWYIPFAVPSVMLEVLACVVLVAACLFFRPVVAFGSTRPLQWLGKRSFSLYLVHEPIILTVVNVIHLTNPLLVSLIVIPAALIVAEIFYRLIERPSHRLSMWVGKRIASASGRRRAHRGADEDQGLPTSSPSVLPETATQPVSPN